MAYLVSCPCGVNLYGLTDNDVIEAAQAHLADQHDRAYTPDEIMTIAVEVPDRLVNGS